MKAAIIDVGSNSIRLLLGTYTDGQWHNEPKRLWTTRLGKRNEDGSLTTESMDASYKAFSEIATLAKDYGVDHCLAFCNECRSRSIKWHCVYGASHDILLHDVSYLKW